MTDEVFNIVSAIGIGLTFLASIVLMLSWAVIISLLSCCHEIARISVMECSFCDGADSRPITKGISSCIHALPAL